MVQRELSPIQLIVLGLLKSGPMHPYELLRIMRKHADDRRIAVSVGSIYHAVERLERDGYVEAVSTDREGARPERTTYLATPAGAGEHARRTSDLLRSVHREYPAFDVGLGQADALPGPEVVELLTERLDTVLTEDAAMRSTIADIIERGVPRTHLLDALYEIEMRATHIAWIRRTIAEIESGDLDFTQQIPEHLGGPGHRHDVTDVPDITDITEETSA
jgi:DNA-binding PadR family transcriptional regulator